MAADRITVALLWGGAGLLVATLGGVGLAGYVESGAFSFYKQRPPMIAQAPVPSDTSGFYPIRRSDPPTYPYAPTPIPDPAIAAAYAPEPARYAPAAEEDASADIAPADYRPAADEPIIAPQRGSWSEPAEAAGDEAGAAASAGDAPQVAADAGL